MGRESGTRPPAVLRALLRAVLPRRDRDSMTVEMEELYRRRRSRRGAAAAGLWFARAVMGFGVRLAAQAAAGWLRDATTDVRYGARVLRRRPGYAAAAVLTLGLGVGGLTSVHVVADRVLLRAVPGVDASAPLVTVRLGSSEYGRPSWRISHTDLAALERGVDAATALAARTPMDVNLAFDDGAPPLRIRAAATTPGWFEVLGAPLAAGRSPHSGGDGASSGRGEVVVAWEVAASLAPRPRQAVGRTVLVDGHPHRVVGVAARGFRGAELPGETLAWLGPAALVDLVPGAPADLLERGFRGAWSVVVGRLAPGVPPDAVETQANRVMEEVRRSGRPHTFSAAHYEFQAFPGVGLDPGLRGPVGRTLGFLAGAAAFLLLLAALNVTNLTLAHAAARRPATAVREALGAGRGRLIRQALAEHALLGAGGALVGSAVAVVGVRLFRGVRLEEFGASLAALRPGLAALGMSAGLALTAALAAGFAAALGAPGPGAVRLSGGRTVSSSGRRVRAVLASVQVALSTVLVVGAGLMARTVANLRSLDAGFEPAGALAFTIDPTGAGADAGAVLELLDGLRAELEAEPEVESAGFVYPEPLRTSYLTSSLRRSGASEEDRVVGAHLQVAGHFLQAMGVDVVAGRTFLDSEGIRPSGRPPSVVLLTRSGARSIFPDRPLDGVVGARVSRTRGEDPPLTVVGVIEDLRLTGPREDPPPVFVVPWTGGQERSVAVGWVRSRSGEGADLADLAGVVRQAVRRAAPTLPVYDVRTVRQQADRMAAGERVLAGLVTAVSVLGLVLAAVGLHGVLGYAVTERRREIGIRAALGAHPGSLRGRVLAGGLAISVAGLVPGLAAAAVLTRLLGARLFGVEPLDPLTYVAGGTLLLVVAGAASWAPARRTTRVDPVEALRAGG